eukprot:5959052-Prymnesium_polylepis.2
MTAGVQQHIHLVPPPWEAQRFVTPRKRERGGRGRAPTRHDPIAKDATGRVRPGRVLPGALRPLSVGLHSRF